MPHTQQRQADGITLAVEQEAPGCVYVELFTLRERTVLFVLVACSVLASAAAARVTVKRPRRTFVPHDDAEALLFRAFTCRTRSAMACYWCV